MSRILRSMEIIYSHPDFVEQHDNIPIPMEIYTLTKSIRSKIFNYHAYVKDLINASFVETRNTVPWTCINFYLKYTDENHQHILSGDLGIISNLN